MSERTFDVVIWGASGFTGRLVALWDILGAKTLVMTRRRSWVMDPADSQEHR